MPPASSRSGAASTARARGAPAQPVTPATRTRSTAVIMTASARASWIEPSGAPAWLESEPAPAWLESEPHGAPEQILERARVNPVLTLVGAARPVVEQGEHELLPRGAEAARRPVESPQDDAFGEPLESTDRAPLALLAGVGYRDRLGFQRRLADRVGEGKDDCDEQRSCRHTDANAPATGWNQDEQRGQQRHAGGCHEGRAEGGVDGREHDVVETALEAVELLAQVLGGRLGAEGLAQLAEEVGAAAVPLADRAPFTLDRPGEGVTRVLRLDLREQPGRQRHLVRRRQGGVEHQRGAPLAGEAHLVVELGRDQRGQRYERQGDPGMAQRQQRRRLPAGALGQELAG